MVQLRISKECKTGKHDDCKGYETPPNKEFGGWRCVCWCHQTEQWKKLADSKKNLTPWARFEQEKDG